MCEKCDEIDKKIERYRLLLRQVMDQQFNDRTKELIAQMEAEKSALHRK